MKTVVSDIQTVANRITAGKRLLLASDENTLRDLPAGQWIAGTMPFLTNAQGSAAVSNPIYVIELPDAVVNVAVKIYDEANIAQVYNDAPQHGFSVIIIPASCKTHFSFALKAPAFPGFATRPLIGWIAGPVTNKPNAAPLVFDGSRGQALSDGAVVMHVELPASKLAEVDIVNIFEQGEGDTITFPQDGFNAVDALINGEKRNFADYLLEAAIDTRLPLVADLNGAMINTSFKQLDHANRKVSFYAPVFAGLRYKIAKPIGASVDHLLTQLPEGIRDQVVLACVCILNYTYAGLDVGNTTDFTGLITYGEIAYQLLNQTIAYLKIEDA